ncbi:MAG: rRNA maturation RNase YbeY [Zoogloeaceae bacterium]|jgi:probable rRNA maturation factor|nr:rRNA maturation RNase YbeY [Zoogloeaceae bacterium]
MNRLSLSVQYAARDVAAKDLPERGAIRAWAKAALPKPCRGEVTIRLVSAEEGRQLNLQFRGKDKPTNVLSFPYSPPPEIAGDLAICPVVAAREAIEQAKPLAAHYAHLVTHGILHLQGYDHEDAAQAERMEAREREILESLGFPDPYLLGHKS